MTYTLFYVNIHLMSKITRRKRPWASKYTEDTPELYYKHRSEGKTVAQTAKALGTTAKTLYAWADDPNKPEFTEAFKAGHEAHQAWTEDLVHGCLTGAIDMKGARADMLKFKLRTIFRETWAEKKESTININDQTKNLTNEELDEKLEQFLNKALGKGPNLKVVNKESK